MKQVINSIKTKAIEKERKAILRLEMDYELAMLFEAMGENNETRKAKVKKNLKKSDRNFLL